MWAAEFRRRPRVCPVQVAVEVSGYRHERRRPRNLRDDGSRVVRR